MVRWPIRVCERGVADKLDSAGTARSVREPSSRGTRFICSEGGGFLTLFARFDNRGSVDEESGRGIQL